jgi:hypothetical protein
LVEEFGTEHRDSIRKAHAFIGKHNSVSRGNSDCQEQKKESYRECTEKRRATGFEFAIR